MTLKYLSCMYFTYGEYENICEYEVSTNLTYRYSEDVPAHRNRSVFLGQGFDKLESAWTDCKHRRTRPKTLPRRTGGR